MYQILLNNGASLNDSIKEDRLISPLGFSFSDEIGDIELRQDLIKRGCKLNTTEVASLTQLYVDFACYDANNMFDLTNYFENRMKARHMLKDLKHHQGLQLHTANIFNYRRIDAKSNNNNTNSPKSEAIEHTSGPSHATMTSSGSVTAAAKAALQDDDDASKLEMLYNVIQTCGLHRLSILDDNKNNPMHLYVYDPVVNDTSDGYGSEFNSGDYAQGL